MWTTRAEQKHAVDMLLRFKAMYEGDQARMLRSSNKPRVKAQYIAGIRQSVDILDKLISFVEKKKVRPGDRNIVENIRNQMGEVLKPYNDEQILLAWENFSMSEDFPNMDKFTGHIEDVSASS